jgi:hypothetical protein
MADAIVHIARCPEHGLHGRRDECFVCGGHVEQVAMVPVAQAQQRGHDEREQLYRTLSDALDAMCGDGTGAQKAYRDPRVGLPTTFGHMRELAREARIALTVLTERKML